MAKGKKNSAGRIKRWGRGRVENGVREGITNTKAFEKAIEKPSPA